ncbi:MAG: hypothetical protein FJ030_06955 [Chloroflexi bacterium]|nr:hypothetical protein [Chloroflexota bacterium]
MNRHNFNHQSLITNHQLGLLALLLASFALRLHALLQLPGFVDEGNHLLWAAEVWQGRVIFPFSTAKPLEIFFLAALMPFRTPLWVGRLGSVLMGTVTLAGLWAVARQWSGARIGLWAAALYALTPWTFFHERTAVADPLLAATVILAVWVAGAWAARPSRRRGLAFVLCLIALPLIKLNAIVFAALPLLVTALENKNSLARLWLPYAFAGGAVTVVLGAASLRYNVLGEIVDRAESVGGLSWPQYVISNLGEIARWSLVYIDPLWIVIVAGAAVALVRRTPLATLSLAGCALGLAHVALPAAMYPRYFLPALAFASLLAAHAVAFGLTLISARALRRIAGATILFSAGWPFAAFAAQAYRDPAALPLADLDRMQHVAGWPSGYGIREAAAFTGRLIAGESGAVVYANNLATQVVAWLYWPPDSPGKVDLAWSSDSPDIVGVVASGRPTYLIVDTTRDTADFFGLTVNPREMARFERPAGGKPVIVYQLIAEPFAP